MEIEGLRGLNAKLDELKGKMDKATLKGLQAVGAEIVAEAKQNLKRNRTTNTGTLSASGKVQKDANGVDAGFFGKDSSQGYAAAVEYGRGPSKRSGTIPLRETLKAWVKRKLGGKAMRSAAVFTKKNVEQLIEQTAFLIARKIHKHGTKPQPFFTPAVEKVEPKIEDIMSKYINEATK